MILSIHLGENMNINMEKNIEIDLNFLVENEYDKKRKILNFIWNNKNLNSSYSQEILDDYVNLYNILFLKRDLKLSNIIKTHPCEEDNFKKYYKSLKYLHDNGIHSPDCKIIGDAHDLALSTKPLTFVSCDYKMLDAITNLELTFTEIYEFKSVCS